MKLDKTLAAEEARWHHLETAEATRMLDSDLRHGLTSAEAARRLDSFVVVEVEKRVFRSRR